MDNLEQKAVDLLNKIESLAVDYTPDVYQMAVNVVQAQGIVLIVEGFIYGLAAFVFALISKKSYVFCRKKHDKAGDYSDWDMAGFFIALMCAALAGILMLVSIFNVFDMWNWVAVFNPELALAKEIIDSATK